MGKQNNRFSLVVILFIIIVIVGLPMFPVLISGRWHWWEGWTFAGISIFGFIISRILAGLRFPDLIRERSQFMRHKNVQSFDKILAPLLGIGGGLIPLTIGLDAIRGSSASFCLTIKIIAIILILTGYFIGTRALMVNRFFSGMVRIQTERGHYVVSEGPYGCVRHPGYTGALITYLATPFLLDSWWTLIPVGFTIIILVIRTAFEDNTLRKALTGYDAYAQKVRFRLIPWIW